MVNTQSFHDVLKILTQFLLEFLSFCASQEDCRKQWLQAVFECQRLQAKLADSNHSLSEMENKLEHARNLLDQEKRQKRKIEHERDSLVCKFSW